MKVSFFYTNGGREESRNWRQSRGYSDGSDKRRRSLNQGKGSGNERKCMIMDGRSRPEHKEEQTDTLRLVAWVIGRAFITEIIIKLWRENGA